MRCWLKIAVENILCACRAHPYNFNDIAKEKELISLQWAHSFILCRLGWQGSQALSRGNPGVGGECSSFCACKWEEKANSSCLLLSYFSLPYSLSISLSFWSPCWMQPPRWQNPKRVVEGAMACPISWVPRRARWLLYIDPKPHNDTTKVDFIIPIPNKGLELREVSEQWN